MHQEASEETSETDEGKARTPLSMIGPAALLVALAITVGIAPHLGDLLQRASVNFEDQPGYVGVVLGGPAHPAVTPAAETATITGKALIDGGITTAAALALALLWLYAGRLRLRRDDLRTRMSEASAALRPFWALQSGFINDYVTWMVLGLACLGGALALTIH
jgi:hypothetical protein